MHIRDYKFRVIDSYFVKVCPRGYNWQWVIRQYSGAEHAIIHYLSCHKYLPSNIWYKTHFSRQLDCCSLRCSWSIACRRCSNYIFILHLTPGFNRLDKDNCKTRRKSFKFLDLVRLILETIRYFRHRGCHVKWQFRLEPVNWYMYYRVKPLPLIWRSAISRFHLLVFHLQAIHNDITRMTSTTLVATTST